MVPSCYSCGNIYGTWKSKGDGDALKSSFGVANHKGVGPVFMGLGMVSLFNAAILKLYCKSY